MPETTPNNDNLKAEIESADFLGEENQKKLLENFDKLTDEQKKKLQEVLEKAKAERIKQLEAINEELMQEQSLLDKFDKRKASLKESLNSSIEILQLSTEGMDLGINKEEIKKQIDEVIAFNNQVMATLPEGLENTNLLKNIDSLIEKMPEDIKKYYYANKNARK